MKERFGISLILIGGLFLNLWGNEWGLPARWHPDEHFATEAIEIVWKHDKQAFLTAPLYVKSISVGQFIFHAWAKTSGITPASLEDIQELARYSVRPGYEGAAQYVRESIRLARSLSALLAAGTVFIVYLLGRRLAISWASLLGALLLTTSMGFMNLAHFATYDMFTLFFITAAAYWSVCLVHDGRLRIYLLTAFFAALAASGKPIGYLTILMPLVAHLLHVTDGRLANWRRLGQWPSHKKLGWALLFYVLAYLLLNPVWFLEPERFIAYFQSVVGYVFSGVDPVNQAAVFYAPRSNWTVGFFNLAETLGWPLMILMIAGFFWTLLRLRGPNRAALIVLLAWVVPYSLLMGFSSLPMIAARHMVPLFPFLAIFSAQMILANWPHRSRRWPPWVLVPSLAIILYSLAFSVAAAARFSHDSRYTATAWLANNLEDEGQILISGSPSVRAYFPTIPYQAAERLLASRNESDWLLVAEASPRYLVLSSIYYGRYFAWPEAFPEATRFHTELFNHDQDYRLVAQFPPGGLAEPPANAQTLMDFFIPARSGWLTPKPEFVNPTILIFERE